MTANPTRKQVLSKNITFIKLSGHLHVYTIGKELPVKPEEDNKHNKYAAAVMKNGEIVGHLPRTILDAKLSCHVQCRLFVLSIAIAHVGLC